MSRAFGTSGFKPGVPGGTIRALGCWCPVGTVKHRPRRQPRPAATAAPVPTVSARPRRRRVKVFSQVFFKKLARCGAELHGLNRRSRWKKSSGRGARRWCPVGTVQRRPSRQARPTPLATPRPWDSVPHPATFEKVDETFTCLYPAFAEGPALAEGEKAA